MRRGFRFVVLALVLGFAFVISQLSITQSTYAPTTSEAKTLIMAKATKKKATKKKAKRKATKKKAKGKGKKKAGRKTTKR